MTKTILNFLLITTLLLTNGLTGKTIENTSTPIPNFACDVSNLSFGQVIVGQTSTKTVIITNSGTDVLSGNITVPTGYSVSESNNSKATYSIAAVSSKSFIITFSPIAVQAYNGNITITHDATNNISPYLVSVQGLGIPATTPIISVDQQSLSFGDVVVGSTSTKSFTVSGQNLADNITITAPAGFFISTSKGEQTSEKTKNTIVIPHINGIVPATAISLTFAPVLIQSYNGNVVCSSNNAATKYIVVTGNGVSSNSISGNLLPTVTEIQQNYPNPFNPQTTINYSIKDEVPVSINVYTYTGQLVKTLVNGTQKAGYYSVTWNAAGLASGLYFYKMQAGDYQMIKRAMVIK